ncbi:MAG: transposase [Pikeienuella sp.]|uniref:IS66 family transposase n=1 Tax=Pikeienuella sp. TaxID=2831957 RepID=UPI00391A2639
MTGKGQPDRRVEIRRANARPIFDDFEAWLAAQSATLSTKTPLAAAIRYALSRTARLRPWLDHGVLEIDNNAAERA